MTDKSRIVTFQGSYSRQLRVGATNNENKNKMPILS